MRNLSKLTKTNTEIKIKELISDHNNWTDIYQIFTWICVVC